MNATAAPRRLVLIVSVALALVSALGTPMRTASAAEKAGAGKPAPIEVAKLDRSTPVDFEKEILPFLSNSCLACHNKTKAKASLVLETPDDIRKGGDNGPAVVPGKSGESLMFAAASHNAEKPMPPVGNKVAAVDLTGQQLALLRLWIDQGATGKVKGAAPIAWRTLSPSVAPIYAVAVSPDGKLAACGRGDRILLYNLAEPAAPTSLVDPALNSADPDNAAAHRDLVQSLAFSPDGTRLASGGYREVKLWQRKSDGRKESGASPGGWTLERTLGGSTDLASPIADRVNALAFTPDGRWLVTGGGVPSRSGEVRIWSVSDGRLDRSFDGLHTDTILALQVSPDGRRLVTGSADRFVRITDLSSGKVLQSFEGHMHHVLALCWKKDGKTPMSASADGTVRAWEADPNDRKKPVVVSEKEVTALVLTSDGNQFITASGDGKVKLLKESGTEVRSFPGFTDYVYAIALTPDNNTLLAGGQDGVLRAWNVAKGTPISLEPPAPK